MNKEIISTIDVDLDHCNYKIYIGNNILSKTELYTPWILGKKVLIITNENIAKYHISTLTSGLMNIVKELFIINIPDSESSKSIEELNKIYTKMLENNFGRDSVLISFGGGVIGDLTGFAAATYQRGIKFIQIPTTLLSQVDSSIGGKTGINHTLGKNMIGAFYQPTMVVIDINVLRTLKQKELSAGMAEVIKYGLAFDYEFFNLIEDNTDNILRSDPKLLSLIIEKSCKYKVDVVKRDEKEIGDRALLNLGHTYGHAIESFMGYGNWLHGEAISTGMVLAAYHSFKRGDLTIEQVERIVNLFEKFNLPTYVPDNMRSEDFINLMLRDKKNINNQLRLILLKDIGKSYINNESTVEEVAEIIDCWKRRYKVKDCD